MDPILSCVVILVIGWVGGIVSQSLRLPRIICMMLFGIALAPAIHPSILQACASQGVTTSAASQIRTFALLVALARGGLTMSFKAQYVASTLLAFVPYTLELLTEMSLARALLPADSGVASGAPVLVTMLAATLWAPLSPSIVIPNMLTFIDGGLGRIANLVLTAAPFEITTALITYGSVEGALKASASGGTPAAAAGYIPVQIIGSIAFGAAFAGVFYLYRRYRSFPLLVTVTGQPDAMESMVVFSMLYLLSYTLCTDYYVPKLIGPLSALFMGITTQALCPEDAAVLAARWKSVWSFAEAFLFVLTGVVVRGAIDTHSDALSGSFVALLLFGTLARLVGTFIVALAWQFVHAPVSKSWGTDPEVIRSQQWKDVIRRTAFLWSCTVPKATLQASLGPKPATEAAALGISASTAAFMAQTSAISILYMGTLGSLLTHTIGKMMATYLDTLAAEDEKDAAPPEAEALVDGSSEFAPTGAAPSLQQPASWIEVQTVPDSLSKQGGGALQ